MEATIREPLSLDALLSDILDRFESDPFFDPLGTRLPEAERQRVYRSLVKRLGVRYARCSFANYVVYEERADGRPSQREVFEAVQQFAADMPERLRGGAGVVMFGRPGTGKDHLLTALMFWAILRHGWTVRWINALDLFIAARDRISTDDSERKFLAQYHEPQILVISDPVRPKGEATDGQADMLQEIIDRRYRDAKSTWVSINVHDGAEAEARLASPIVDRLREKALCLKCDWESYRARNA